MFDIFLALYCERRGIVTFEMNQLREPISLRKARHHAFTMLMNTPDKIVCHADMPRGLFVRM